MGPRQQLEELVERQNTVLEHMLEKLNGLPDGLRQALSDHLWATIPQTVSEYGFNQSGLTVAAAPDTNGLRRITGIFAYAPGTSGTQVAYIQAGTGRFFPINAGNQLLHPVSFVLQEGEQLSLTLGLPQAPVTTPAGPLVIAGWGDQLPRVKLAGS